MMREADNLSAAIILAAGASTRMGQPKQLLEWKGETMAARACRLAQEAGFGWTIAVTGARAAEVGAAVAGTAAVVADNPNWESGMGGSVAVGLSKALQLCPRLEYAGFILTDQPYLTAGVLSQMLAALKGSAAPGIAAAYEGVLGVPAVFRARIFPELLSLAGQKGARPVLQKYASALLAFPFQGGGFDLDYPEDYERLLRGS
ncbi:nucleotidyltransferase family protein [Phaeodactylibacter luteus]|uniref:Nucleotidyltransferase family protein n=1 Tax=Phaeodactylibacter luteus TaxID=1564516 RepID=A0A5C6S1G5_9BACT|nr:nucleotidyltransferase family protein [Phaeodactylibacter luteus]TXB67680.1 nucleotidyltransferase family protein [Phaeodactylibacter luteus]